MVSFVLITMSLFHIFFPPYSSEYLQHKSTLNKIVKNRDSIAFSIIENHRKSLINNELDSVSLDLISTKLVSDYRTHYENYKTIIKNFNTKKKKLALEHSFLGRKSFHFWVFVFGLVSALMFFSCKSLYSDIVNGSTYRFQFISLTGIAVSFFWMIHLIFFTQKDFSKHNYFLMIIGCACLATFFTYFLVKNYTYKDDIILKQLSLIDKIKTIHYPRVALKALYAERNDKAMLATDTVRENADAFDHDILTTLKDV